MDHPAKFPSLGGVAVAKRLTGWSVTFLHTLKKTTPALRATPPKEGNFLLLLEHRRQLGWEFETARAHLGGRSRAGT